MNSASACVCVCVCLSTRGKCLRTCDCVFFISHASRDSTAGAPTVGTGNVRFFSISSLHFSAFVLRSSCVCCLVRASVNVCFYPNIYIANMHTQPTERSLPAKWQLCRARCKRACRARQHNANMQISQFCSETNVYSVRTTSLSFASYVLYL